MKILPATLKLLHTLLNATGMIELKRDLVQEYSATKVTSSKDLLESEALALCAHLRTLPGADVQKVAIADPADVMRKKIIRFAHLMGWELTPMGKPDMPRIDGWVRKYGYLNRQQKGLNDYTVKELPRLVTQFEEVYIKFLEAPL
jgi:hypothetical protein